MRSSTKFTLQLTVMLLILFSGIRLKADDYQTKAEPVSYAEADLSKKQPTIVAPTGSSSISSLKLGDFTGAVYRSKYDTWSLAATQGAGISFDLDLSVVGRVQMAMEVAAALVNGTPHDPYLIKVENARGGTWVTPKPIIDDNPNFHTDVLEIPQSAFSVGRNKVTIYLTTDASTQLFVKNVKFLPQKVVASNGALQTTLYTQFGETKQVTGVGTPENAIWTRGYGLDRTTEMIPGPTLFFKPGDLLNVNLVNLLNPAENEVLAKYEKMNRDNVNTDEILADDEIRGEINIPHNLNNTNLHVHGLHVDPAKDDVTIVIVPEGVDTANYDAPHSHMPVSKLDELNEYSVSDQGVKPGSWDYQYKIPETHLPGTHWFHPHKHGSTSAQVENGLAGTLVIQEDESNAIVPYPNKANSVLGGKTQSNYNLAEWQGEHDRVFAIQEITNFGAQKGKGNKKGGNIDRVDANTIDLTVNGRDSLGIAIQPNQLERWRLVNAGTNHRAFSHVWLGKKLEKTDPENDNAPIYQSVDMFMVAADGITLAKMDTVNAENPALLAPGNRSDFLVKLNEPGDYVLFKNFNANNGATILNSAGKVIYRSNRNSPTFWPAIANTKNNPYLFSNTGTTQSNLGGFVQNWNGQLGKPVVPLIKTKEVDNGNGNFLDVDFALSSSFKKGSVGEWQPASPGGGAISDGELVFIKVSGSPVDHTQTPDYPSNDYLKTIAPTTSGKAPAYVSTLKNEDVLQSRPVIFDVSGVTVKVTSENDPKKSNNVNQFTLNGRFFTLNDPIGNPKGNSLIQASKKDPSDIEYGPDQPNIPQQLDFVTSAAVSWKTNKVGDSYFFTNPGYYQSIDLDDNGAFSYSGVGTPSWEKLSGVKDVNGKPRPAVANKKATQYFPNENAVSALPLAQSGEEWILINNSDVSHPFHIHINPFFVVEVGQLSYEKFENGNEWVMRAVTADTYPQRPTLKRDSTNTFNEAKAPSAATVYQGDIATDAIVGNWWDTIIIPAHGYVKVRYWFNVPNQTGSGLSAQVQDNFNKTGIWVYHCHILRHEDRGMMMPVVTSKNQKDADK